MSHFSCFQNGVATSQLTVCPLAQVAPATSVITVRKCTRGEVAPSTEMCQLCASSTYSFDPHAAECNMPCPANADCRGGQTLVPWEQYWHSAADSEAMIACPSPSACQGDRDALAACQNPSNATLAIDPEHQVITCGAM